MMYSQYYLVLTLLSMIGLALPSNPQRKISKGSKKNPSLLFQDEIPVLVLAPLLMRVPEVKATVVAVVQDILSDTKRRDLFAFTSARYSVQTTDMTQTECTDKLSVHSEIRWIIRDNPSVSVACYKAIIAIESMEAQTEFGGSRLLTSSTENLLPKAISTLKKRLVEGVTRHDITVRGTQRPCPWYTCESCTCIYNSFGDQGITEEGCVPLSKLAHCPDTAPCSTTKMEFSGQYSSCAHINDGNKGKYNCNDIIAHDTDGNMYSNCMDDPSIYITDGSCKYQSSCYATW